MMTTLVQKMAEDMRARGLATETIERRIAHLEAFAAYNPMMPLPKRSATVIRAYQFHLLVEERASWDSVRQVVEALRFFYEVTLGIPGVVAELTPLRLRMIDDMRIRNYSPHTMRNHLRRIALLATYFRRPPDQLGPEDLRACLVHLVEKKASAPVFNQFVSAFRFFYRVTLKKRWVIEGIPSSKKPKRLPDIPTREKILVFLEGIPNIKHRAILTTCYAAGLRLSEVTHLKVSDIDSGRMVLHVRQGKGKKDRIIPLSETLLHLLREYWRVVQPRDWLFPSDWSGGPLSSNTVARVCDTARRRVGITQKFTVHTLRHNAARRIMPTGGCRSAARGRIHGCGMRHYQRLFRKAKRRSPGR